MFYNTLYNVHSAVLHGIFGLFSPASHLRECELKKFLEWVWVPEYPPVEMLLIIAVARSDDLNNVLKNPVRTGKI